MKLNPPFKAHVQPLRAKVGIPASQVRDAVRKSPIKLHPQIVPPSERKVLDATGNTFTEQITSPQNVHQKFYEEERDPWAPKLVPPVHGGDTLVPERWQNLYAPKQAFYIAKYKPMTFVDPMTVRWIRNESDERAAQERMRFSEERGLDVVDWVEEHCVLYEGSRANTPLYCDDWQYEYFMQLFGWLRYSEEMSQWLRRFTHAGIWIAKKNAKSPTLAATGLYMLIGDGEPGQKCYSVARDGKQARIAHNHAIEMVKNSVVLLAECKINHADGVIRHIPSKSRYEVVHAGNSMSTEGFNGSLFCDETHVLVQIHMDRLKRAGISRLEPLHVEVSTAGNNADEYGFNRYEYGRRISTLGRMGDIDISDKLKLKTQNYNPHFLFIDFSIDQKVTLDKLRDEEYVMSISQTCNPALGRILRREEFRSDYNDSTLSETELRKFAMYRLNLWLKDSAAWVELSDWLKCAVSPLSRQIEESTAEDAVPRRQYKLEDLQEFPCVGGLDLSKTRDMSAFSLIFAVPDDELGVRPYTWTWHWLPRKTAQMYHRYIDFESEQFKPWLQLVNTRTVNYETIATRINWCREHFDLREVGYDVFNAADCIRYLITDHMWSEKSLIKVPQTMRYMGPITQEFERWVLRHEVHHPNNSLLNWQFQHVALDFDRLGNYRVIKPNKDDYRKIDGVVSLLIAGLTLTSNKWLWTKCNNSILLFDREEAEQYGDTERLAPSRHDARSANDYDD